MHLTGRRRRRRAGAALTVDERRDGKGRLTLRATKDSSEEWGGAAWMAPKKGRVVVAAVDNNVNGEGN